MNIAMLSMQEDQETEIAAELAEASSDQADANELVTIVTSDLNEKVIKETPDSFAIDFMMRS